MNAEFPNVEAPNTEAPNVESHDPEACCDDCPARRIVNGRMGSYMNPEPAHPVDILTEAVQVYNGICELLAVGYKEPDMGCVQPYELFMLLDVVRKKLKAALAGFDAQP